MTLPKQFELRLQVPGWYEFLEINVSDGNLF